jgi:ligand-binding sensor domain-containing protein
MHTRTRAAAAALLAGACVLGAGAAQATDGYHLEKVVTIPGGDSGWDYNSLDDRHDRIFIAHRKEGLHVYDIKTGKVLRTLAGSSGANTSALAPEFDLGIAGTTDGYIVVFKLSTLKTVARYKSDTDGFDGATYDPVSKRFAAVGEADEARKQTPVLFFDARTGKPVGSVVVDSAKVDAPRADGQGNIWMPLRDRAALVRVDVKAMQVAATVALKEGCRKPAALELDNAAHRIYVGCRGDAQAAPRLQVVDADSGREITSVPIGRGVDEVMVDARRGLIMTANGEEGSLSVIRKLPGDRFEPVETVGTRPMARTGVLDERSGKIYLVNAQYVKMAQGSDEEQSTHFLPNTFSVLTYAK